MNKKILIIDDNDQDRKMMARVLDCAGFADVILATDGESGIDKAKTDKPDIIVIDTVLPGIDGLGACRAVRKIDNLKTSKIIIITGLIDAVDAVAARRMGADDYIVKTADYEPLVASVKKLI